MASLRAGRTFRTSRVQYAPPTLFACQPNFQLDGCGIWLWAFAPHLSHQRRAPAAGERAAVRLVARYLQAVGDSPCYDCWE